MTTNPFPGTVKVKQGERGVVFHPETWMRHQMHRINLVVRISAPSGHEVEITSGVEGRHSSDPWSKHYIGWALDYGIKKLTSKEIDRWVDLIEKNLGPEYYVELEGNHIHIHYIFKGDNR